jgi:hypothetical protein
LTDLARGFGPLGRISLRDPVHAHDGKRGELRVGWREQFLRDALLDDRAEPAIELIAAGDGLAWLAELFVCRNRLVVA